MPGRTGWRKIGGRLLTMSGAEVWTRGRQGVLKRWDAGLHRFGFGRGVNGFTPSPHLQGARTPNDSQARFFWNSSDLPELITIMRETLPHEVERTIEEANGICQHRLHLLGYQDLDFGPQIDWHSDVVNGKRAPRKPWFKIRYLDFDEVGDHKIVWELNRHQHLVTLAKAYCFTHEERYAAELLRQWYHWQQENPYPIGINWASSLEVAFRTLSWLWVRHLLADCPLVTEGFRLDLLRAVTLNGQHIEQYLSTYFSPNTHLLGEAVALFFAGTLCPELPHARRWQQQGGAIVWQQAERQVQPDGMHFEQSVYYHVYALDFFLHARMLAVCNKIPIPAGFDQTIERMLEALAALAQAGPPPQLGDGDGGRVFNPRRNLIRHMLDPLATGAVVFLRRDFKAAAGGLREETVWLLGPERAIQFDALPLTKRSPVSTGLASSGIYIMADSNPVPQQLVIDGGPQGAGRAGHGHADALSLCLSVNGREWLADSGTFSYASNGTARPFGLIQGECHVERSEASTSNAGPSEKSRFLSPRRPLGMTAPKCSLDEMSLPATPRDSFRGTAAHNTLRIDGLSQAIPDGLFAWCSLPQVRADRWVTGKTFDLFAGSHAGYCRLTDPVVHRRWVFHLKSGFWFVRDLAEGEKVHQLDLFWHFAAGIVPRSDAASNSISFAREEAPDRETLTFIPLQGHGWEQEINQGSVSPVYGRQEPAAVLRFSTRTQLPAEFAVLLLSSGTGVSPVAHSQEAALGKANDGRATCWRAVEKPEALTELARKGAGARGYCYRGANSSHYLFFRESRNRIERPQEPAPNAVKGVPLHFAKGGGRTGHPREVPPRPLTRWNLGPWESDAQFLYFGTGSDRGQHWVICDGSYVQTRGQPALTLKSSSERFEWVTDNIGRQIYCSDESAVSHATNQAFVEEPR